MAILTEVSLKGGPYDSTGIVDTVNGIPIGDKAITAAFMASMISSLVSDGVVYDKGNELSVEYLGGMTVRVNPGVAWVRGYMARLDDALTFDLSAGHEYTVYLRQNYGLGEAVVGVFEDNVNTIPLRFNGIYDIVLGKVKIPSGAMNISSSMITDTRADSVLCGFVTSKARNA